MKKNILLMAKIFAFLSQLSDQQIEEFVSGNAKLKLSNSLSDSRNKQSRPTSKFDSVEICRVLESMTTRESARNYLSGLSLTRAQLKDFLDSYKISNITKESNVQLIDRLVEAAVGAKLKHDALLNMKKD